MFHVNQYKIVFKRVWHKRMVTPQELKYVSGNGRYDTKCEIYDIGDGVKTLTPRFTGIARLHPNDKPNKIVGKKIALRNAMGYGVTNWGSFGYADFYTKEVRTAIWKAFWGWVSQWKNQQEKRLK